MKTSFNIKPSYGDIANSRAAIYKLDQYSRTIYRLCIILLILCLLAVNISPQTAISIFYPMAYILIAIIFLPLFRWIHFQNYYKFKKESFFKERTYSIDDEFVKVQTSFCEVALHWNIIDAVVKKREFYIVSSGFLSVDIYLKYLTLEQINELEQIVSRAKDTYNFKIYQR